MKSVASESYPHVIDPYGTLWYLDGDRIVRQPRPASVRVLRDANAESGTIFWYDRYAYVLDGDGRRFTRVGQHFRTRSIRIPAAQAPIVGATADSAHRAIIAAQLAPHRIAVVDNWRWYEEHLPSDVDPFTAALAGGPHGKRYLLLADPRSASVAVKDRSAGVVVFVNLPDNRCFARGGSALRVPVDVAGRDTQSAWATSGEQIVTIDLRTKRIVRVWNVDGCATHILKATRRSAIVVASAPARHGFTSSLVKVDDRGVQPLTAYGEIPGLGAGADLDAYGRLWWFDPRARAFICRTPLG